MNKASGSGTVLQGYVTASYNRLVEVFGLPHYRNGDKSTVEWSFEEEGVRFTLYDYRWASLQNDTPEEWHIGGDDVRAIVTVNAKLGIF